jgi:hypothetical protein
VGESYFRFNPVPGIQLAKNLLLLAPAEVIIAQLRKAQLVIQITIAQRFKSLTGLKNITLTAREQSHNCAKKDLTLN